MAQVIEIIEDKNLFILHIIADDLGLQGARTSANTVQVLT